jgi:orotate phosphoribosyltransferase
MIVLSDAVKRICKEDPEFAEMIEKLQKVIRIEEGAYKEGRRITDYFDCCWPMVNGHLDLIGQTLARFLFHLLEEDDLETVGLACLGLEPTLMVSAITTCSFPDCKCYPVVFRRRVRQEGRYPLGLWPEKAPDIVILVDDVITTGKTLRQVRDLVDTHLNSFVRAALVLVNTYGTDMLDMSIPVWSIFVKK